MADIPNFTLPSGAQVPIIAYGTGTAWFKAPDADPNEIDRATVDAIKTAIKLGYRHLDGAQAYKTENELGLAIVESGVPRSDFFLTTKAVSISDIRSSLEQSLRKLRTEYVDLYLIHSPFDASSREELETAWKEMEQCQKRGLAKNIGLSNCTIPILDSVFEIAEIPPAVAQIEIHPYLQQPRLMAELRRRNMVIEGFASLTPLTTVKEGPVNGVCERLSKKYGVSQSAILLRWTLDLGCIVITTSGSEERLKGYLDEVPSFALADAEVEEISKVSEEEYFRGFFGKQLTIAEK